MQHDPASRPAETEPATRPSEPGTVADRPRSLPFRLDAMVLVCKACGKRSSGPRDAKPKQVAREVKSAAKEGRLKTRIVMTSCLGLCPKRATAITVIAAEAAPAQYAVQSLAGVAAVLPAARRRTPD